jgi:hypothetical protein
MFRRNILPLSSGWQRITPMLVNLMMEVICSFETSDLTITTQSNTSEDGILQRDVSLTIEIKSYVHWMYMWLIGFKYTRELYWLGLPFIDFYVQRLLHGSIELRPRCSFLETNPPCAMSHAYKCHRQRGLEKPLGVWEASYIYICMCVCVFVYIYETRRKLQFG